MRLKKLEVFGFKSFFDKTTITFEKGITGIVGPNGCGKSNFADAILWVLGEQKPKNLRGERMEDVIFGGTEHRKPLSVAEVSLTISDIHNELPAPYTPYAELCFSRRLYRSGECDYLINKSPCRLKDIRDLLIDIGAGYRAHTIIEQGKVDELITASPMQRRELVEEAAGIAKYRLRKAEALRKLEATERNLLRVSDIIGEIKRQRNALDRQAKKAEKSQALTGELKALELQLAKTAWCDKKNEQKAIEDQEKRSQDNMAKISASLALSQTQQEQHQVNISDHEKRLRDQGRRIAENETTIQGLEGTISTLRAQVEAWLSAENRTQTENTQIATSITQLQSEKEALASELKQTGTEEREKETRFRQQESETTAARQVAQENQEALAQLKLTLFDLSSVISTATNNLLHFENLKERLLRQKIRLEQEHASINQGLSETRSAILSNQQQTQDNTAILSNAKQAQQENHEQVTRLDREYQDQEQALQKQKEAWLTFKAQAASEERAYRGFLGNNMDDEHSALISSKTQTMVADLIEVPALYERAIEAFLENRLRGILFTAREELLQGLQKLRQQKAGRGIFLPRQPRLTKRQYSEPKGEGIEGSALKLISFHETDRNIAIALFSAVVIVKNLEIALRYWEQNDQIETWLCLDGTVLEQNGMVSGGEARTAGPLQSKRIWQESQQQAQQSHLRSEALQAELLVQQKHIQSVRADLADWTEKIKLCEITRLQTQNAAKALENEQTRLEEALETLLFELEEGASEELNRIESVQKEEDKISIAAKSKTTKDLEIVALDQQYEKDQAHLTLLKEALISLRLESNALKTKARHLTEKRDRANIERKKLLKMHEEKQQFLSSLLEKNTIATREIEEARTKIIEVSECLVVQREEERQAQESLAVLHRTFETEKKDILELQNELGTTKEHLQTQALKRLEVVMSRENIEKTILQKYEIDISTDDDSKPLDPTSKKEISEAVTQVRVLQQQLEKLGAVNMDSIEEYKTLDTRFQFLETQENDLRQAIDSLNAAITKINRTTKGLFVETFHTLNQKFSEVYTSFFGGGNAELVLSDEAHPLDSGIELFAQPPGKGKRNILLLSGGEKALTAISLLFATFLIHPTPFCLLDEIDAPLDEENTRRFSQTLLEMSEETQFIVVTHNKHTMEIADVLYGVTMEESGLSKLVSVDLKKI